MKKYIRAYDESYKDNEITQVLIHAIEKGDMKYFTEWNAVAYLSGYYKGESMDLAEVVNSVNYVFNNCENLKYGELLRPIENYARYD